MTLNLTDSSGDCPASLRDSPVYFPCTNITSMHHYWLSHLGAEYHTFFFFNVVQVMLNPLGKATFEGAFDSSRMSFMGHIPRSIRQ